MGEWQKSIGEKGERITKFIFEDIIGYNSLSMNQSINCIHEKKHKSKRSKKGRITHGIDGLIYYVSPLEDDALDIAVISSKYTKPEYPKYPKSKIRDHLTDLAQTLECFYNSKLKSNLNKNVRGVERTNLFGVLAWLSDSSDLNYEVIPKLGNIRLDTDLVFDKIILLDNNRVNFLYQSIHKSKEIYGEKNVDYVYHSNTVLNKFQVA